MRRRAPPSGLELRAAEKLLPSVLPALSSSKTREAYRTAILDFFAWLESSPHAVTQSSVETWRTALRERGLAPSSVNQRLSALRWFFSQAADHDLLPRSEAADLQAVRNVQPGAPRLLPTLTASEAGRLLAVPDAQTMLGKRDGALLALLLGCGLRRQELIGLQVRQLRQREGRWVLLRVGGNGGGQRTVPLPAWVKEQLDRWLQAAAIAKGALFRPVRKNGTVNLEAEELSDECIYSLVKHAGAAMGKPELTPSDLRRTCAQLCREAGGPLEQIQFLLGHASVQTTARYLRTKQELRDAVNDRVRIPVQRRPKR